MARESWQEDDPIVFTHDFVPPLSATIKAGTKAVIKRPWTGFLGGSWAVTVSLTVQLANGRIVTAPISYFKR